MLTNACLANRDAQALIAERREPYSESGLRRHPIVRIDFEEGFAIASIGEELAATRCKHWAELSNAHDALADVRANAAVWREMERTPTAQAQVIKAA